MGLGVGATVPEFSLPDQDGNSTSFSSLLQSSEKGLVLFFYPKDETTGCTAEVRCFAGRGLLMHVLCPPDPLARPTDAALAVICCRAMTLATQT